MENLRGLSALAVVCAWMLFGGALLAARLRQRMHGGGATARRDVASWAGMALQGLGFAIVWGANREHATFWPGMTLGGATVLAFSTVTLAFGSAMLGLLAVRELGKQWSLTARVLVGHELVRTGPFAHVRHPIYSALLGLLLATGLALSTAPLTALAAAIYLAGTWWRAHSEEALLRGHFGGAYDDYARRVPRLLPRPWARRAQEAAPSAYASRLAQESARFDAEVDVHALPEIFHYWSNRYLKPLFEQFGIEGINDFFAKQIAAANPDPSRPLRIVGIGSGDCAVELDVARRLLELGYSQLSLACTDVSAGALARGRDAVRGTPLEYRVQFLEHDVNRGLPPGEFDVAIANQSLHHVVELERLFDSVRERLAGGGRFLVSDVIGRNGHQRWPEARRLLEPFWAELPESHKYHGLLRRQENEFLDWDCSREGFEGIRAQDVLPQLLSRFHASFFLAWGNIIDVFIDRGFGHHYRAQEEWELRFIDRVQQADADAIAAGTISPTHLLASFQVAPCECVHLPGMRPQDALRKVGSEP
jgi:SAM-dependent methyltransferase/isoprenylcysteine carboxyl methyltransferase (ICMT) family protein YpbQ